MAADGLTHAVRHRLGLGRLLPLGNAGDSGWVTEETAAGVLRAAVAGALPGIRLDSVRISAAAEPETESLSAPPGALPHGPLRIEAHFATAAGGRLQAIAEQLRAVLLAAADGQLGLRAHAADLHVTDLLDEPYDAPAPEPGPAPAAESRSESGVGAAVLGVPGVTCLAPVLGGLSTRGVSRNVPDEGADRGLLIQCAVAADRRVLDVARAVRAAAVSAAQAENPDQKVSVTVLVTAVGDRQPGG